MTNKTKPQTHTPGPWAISSWNPQLVVRDNGVKSSWIATISDQETRPRGNKEPQAESMVNGRLIAAAPDMKAMLDYIAYSFDSWVRNGIAIGPKGGDYDTLAKIHALLAKIEGMAK